MGLSPLLPERALLSSRDRTRGDELPSVRVCPSQQEDAAALFSGSVGVSGSGSAQFVEFPTDMSRRAKSKRIPDDTTTPFANFD
jgi:hypothetical protein